MIAEGTLPNLRRLDIFLPIGLMDECARQRSDTQIQALSEVNSILRPLLQRVPSLCQVSLMIPRLYSHDSHLDPSLFEGWTESVTTHDPPVHPVVVARHWETPFKIYVYDTRDDPILHRLVANMFNYRLDNVVTERLYRLGE